MDANITHKRSPYIMVYNKEIDLLLPHNIFEFAVYIWLRRYAKLRGDSIRYKGKRQFIPAGHTLISYRDIATVFRSNESKMRRTLRSLEGHGLIRLESNNHHTIVLLINHQAYLSEMIKLRDRYGATEFEAWEMLSLINNGGKSEQEANDIICKPRKEYENSLNKKEEIAIESDALNFNDNESITECRDAQHERLLKEIKTEHDAANNPESESLIEPGTAQEVKSAGPNFSGNETLTKHPDAQSIDISINSAIKGRSILYPNKENDLECYNLLDEESKIKIADFIGFLNKERTQKPVSSTLSVNEEETIGPILRRLEKGYDLEALKSIFLFEKGKHTNVNDIARTTHPRTLYGEKFESYLELTQKIEFDPG